jgi:hypothetical protein
LRDVTQTRSALVVDQIGIRKGAGRGILLKAGSTSSRLVRRCGAKTVYAASKAKSVARMDAVSTPARPVDAAADRILQAVERRPAAALAVFLLVHLLLWIEARAAEWRSEDERVVAYHGVQECAREEARECLGTCAPG